MPVSEEILLKLTGDAAGATKALRAVEAGLASFSQRAQASARKADESFEAIQSGLRTLETGIQKVGKVGQILAVVFGGIAAAGGGLIKTTAQVAMRNEVLALSMYVVGENAGFGREELDMMVQSMKDLGITTSQSMLGITRMIQGELDLGKATNLARTAQDLAVIAGENSSETYGNLMEAIVSLQPQMLRQYGIVTTLDQALGDLANSTDTTAKRQAFFDFVLGEGAKVAGVYEEAMGVVGKQITSIPRLVEEVKAAFGKYFLPIIGKGVEVISKLLKWFEKLPEPVKRTLAIFTLVGTALAGVTAIAGGVLAAIAGILGSFTSLAMGIVGLVSAVPLVTAGLTATGAILTALSPVIVPLAVAIGVLLVGALTALGTALAAITSNLVIFHLAWKNNWGGIRSVVEDAWEEIKSHIERLKRLIGEWGELIGGQLRRVWVFFVEFLRRNLEPAFTTIANFIKRIDWSGFFSTLSDALNVAGKIITSWLETLERLLRGEGFRAFSSLKDAAIDALTLIALVFDKYIKKAAIWGWNLIVNVANGIAKAAQSVLVKVMKLIGNIIGRFLAPGSPPKEGPLSNIINWARGVMNTYLRAFGLADFGLMRKAIAPIRDVLESAISAGDIDEADFVAVFGQVREQVAALIANFRDTGEISERLLSGIAESLGEGSEEYVKFLKLQLEHQRALENLRSVEQEVEEARAAGFIPRALKERLKAAEEEAQAAEDAVSWQEEYLAMQQESIDLQLRLVETLEKLADALDEISQEPATGEGGILDEKAADDIDALSKGLGGLKKQLGKMSPEFLEMRKKVEAWIEKVRLFLSLPFRAQLAYIALELEGITGIPFYDYLMKIFNFIDRIDKEGLATVIGEWIAAGIEAFKLKKEELSTQIETFLSEQLGIAVDNLLTELDKHSDQIVDWLKKVLDKFIEKIGLDPSSWGDKIKDFLIIVLAKAVEALYPNIGEDAQLISDWISDVWQKFIDLITLKDSEWGQKIKDFFDGVFDALIGFLNSDILTYGLKLFLWLVGTIADMVVRLIGAAANIGLSLWNAFAVGLGEWLTNAWNNVTTWSQQLIDWIKGVIDGLITSAEENAGTWVAGLVVIGAAIVETIMKGLSDAWVMVTDLLSGLLDGLRSGPADEADEVERIDKKGLLKVIGDWIDEGIQFVKDNWEGWAETIKDFLLDMFEKAIELLTEAIEESKEMLSEWFSAVWQKFIDWLGTVVTQWGQKLKDFIDAIYATLISLLTMDIPTYGLKLYLWVSGTLYNMMAKLAQNAAQIGRDLWSAVKTGFDAWISNMWLATGTYTQELIDWIKSVISGLIESAKVNAAAWVDGIKVIGTAIVDKIKGGISSTWSTVETTLSTLLSGLGTALTSGFQNWFYGVDKIGSKIVDRIISGVGNNWYRLINYIIDLLNKLKDLISGSGSVAGLIGNGLTIDTNVMGLQRQLTSLSAVMSGGSTGEITINQYFEGGINFPNVTDGRDAVSVRRELDREATRAIMTGRVMGYA